jgi:hypothetical protein
MEQAGILSDVQNAEQTRRELIFNTVALYITGFALISVFTDAYDFVLNGNGGEAFGVTRTQLFLYAMILLVVVLFVVRRIIVKSHDRIE